MKSGWSAHSLPKRGVVAGLESVSDWNVFSQNLAGLWVPDHSGYLVSSAGKVKGDLGVELAKSAQFAPHGINSTTPTRVDLK